MNEPLDDTIETPALNKWMASLSEDAREIIMLARTNIERLDGNVQMADALATFAFKKAIESGSGLSDMSTRDMVEVFKVAGQLVNISSQLKEQRIRLNDEFKGILDLPKPASLEYRVVEASPLEQIRRLIAMDMRPHAETLARQHGFDMEALAAEVTAFETPEDGDA